MVFLTIILVNRTIRERIYQDNCCKTNQFKVCIYTRITQSAGEPILVRKNVMTPTVSN